VTEWPHNRNFTGRRLLTLRRIERENKIRERKKPGSAEHDAVVGLGTKSQKRLQDWFPSLAR